MGSIGTLMGLDIRVPDYSMICDNQDSRPVCRVLTRFVLKYTVRVAQLERGGVNLDFAVVDDILPSAEHTHKGDRVGETQSIVATPPQGDLAPVGFEKAGIANQTGARDVGVGNRWLFEGLDRAGRGGSF